MLHAPVRPQLGGTRAFKEKLIHWHSLEVARPFRWLANYEVGFAVHVVLVVYHLGGRGVFELGGVYLYVVWWIAKINDIQV